MSATTVGTRGGPSPQDVGRLAHERNYCVVVVTHDTSVLDLMDVTYRMRDGVLFRD